MVNRPSLRPEMKPRRHQELEQLTAEALKALARADTRPRCPNCGLAFGGPAMLAEHCYHHHGGAVPWFWARTGGRAGPLAD